MIKYIERIEVVSDTPGMIVKRIVLTPEGKKALSVPRAAWDRACGRRSFWGRVYDFFFWRGPKPL